MDTRFDNLPPLMRDAIQALQDLHNTPDSLAMPAVLGIANLAAMPHYRVESILFSPIPISLFILCMLPTGMRKSTNYKEIEIGIKRFETLKRTMLQSEAIRYEMDQKVFKKAQARYIKDRDDNGMFGTVPVPDPVRPIETTNYRLKKGTLNGIIDQLKSQPFVGLFSDEAGEFFNSHAFQGGRDGQNKSIEISAGLTSMFDGSAITKQTGMDSVYLQNRAVNMMFFLQEETVRAFLNNPIFSAQGFVHRILITQSQITEKPRFDLSDAGIARLARLRKKLDPFHDRIEQIISRPLRTVTDRDFELDFEVLHLTANARVLAEHYANEHLHDGEGILHDWQGFSERIYELLIRIAATLTAFERKTAVDEVDIAGAMGLMDYFIEQRLSLEMGVTSRNQQLTLSRDRLASWIQDHKFEGTRNELRRRVRWFGALSEAEKTEILEDLVRGEQLWIRVAQSSTGRDVARYSWQEEA